MQPFSSINPRPHTDTLERKLSVIPDTQEIDMRSRWSCFPPADDPAQRDKIKNMVDICLHSGSDKNSSSEGEKLDKEFLAKNLVKKLSLGHKICFPTFMEKMLKLLTHQGFVEEWNTLELANNLAKMIKEFMAIDFDLIVEVDSLVCARVIVRFFVEQYDQLIEAEPLASVVAALREITIS